MNQADGRELISPRLYGELGVPHQSWAELRRQGGLPRFEPQGFDSFHAVVRHRDVCEISKRPDVYWSRRGIVLESKQQRTILERESGIGSLRAIIVMDPPEHRDYRKVASPWFTPRAIARVDPVAQESAKALVDGLVRRARDGEGECEFATEIATAHPLRILSTILGVPREEEPRILELTTQLFASDDPDLQREGEDRRAAAKALALDFAKLFREVIEDRRANPRDDLATVLANGRVNGEAMGPAEMLGYFLIVFTAGHDTTKNALVGGLEALARHPGEFAKLKRAPELVPSAVEEILRWSSPVNYMKRVVGEDVEYRGTKLRKGDNLVLFYASANRDEALFDDPFSFRVDRAPNPHLAFGIGEHFCLGAHLARRSQRALLAELVRRIDAVELAAEPERIHSSFVVGLKRLPLRYRIGREARAR